MASKRDRSEGSGEGGKKVVKTQEEEESVAVRDVTAFVEAVATLTGPELLVR